MGQNPGSGKYHIELTQTFKMRPKDFSARDDGGKFDFNKTPLALPGTKVVFHEKTNRSRTYGQHRV